MSVRHALLALLSEGPKYGLQLRQEFEARTGEVWPLNVGQVYTTLQRLERDRAALTAQIHQLEADIAALSSLFIVATFVVVWLADRYLNLAREIAEKNSVALEK